MIRPSELLKCAEGYKHFIFYGSQKISGTYRHGTIEKGYWDMELDTIDWKYDDEDLGGNHYNYGKLIQSICCGTICADFVAKILDKFMRVDMFAHDEDTLYVYCVLR